MKEVMPLNYCRGDKGHPAPYSAPSMPSNNTHSHCTPTDKTPVKRPLWFPEMFSDRQSEGALIGAAVESLNSPSSLGGGYAQITLSIDNICGNGMCFGNGEKERDAWKKGRYADRV